MDVGGLKSEEYLKMNPHGKVGHKQARPPLLWAPATAGPERAALVALSCVQKGLREGGQRGGGGGLLGF